MCYPDLPDNCVLPGLARQLCATRTGQTTVCYPDWTDRNSCVLATTTDQTTAVCYPDWPDPSVCYLDWPDPAACYPVWPDPDVYWSRRYPKAEVRVTKKEIKKSFLKIDL